MYKLGVDIGGTFTDIVLSDSKGFYCEKVLTTPKAPELGAIKGIASISKKHSISFADISAIIHGTTLAANSIIQRKGAKTAFITTKGFRDVLEMQFEKRFDQYDLNTSLPTPLVPRNLRFTVEERCLASGKILHKPKEEKIISLAHHLSELGIEAVAIGFLHSYANSQNEKFVKRILKENLSPNITICTSNDICPEAREYERFSTTVANSFVRPLMINYLNDFEKALKKFGFVGSLFLLSSDAGITTIEQAKKTPIRLVESGPAGGVAFASIIAKSMNENKVISLDIGGTTAKICYLVNGEAIKERRFEIARTKIGKKGSGLPLRIPSIDLLEIGAGGGSVAKIDDLGRIQIGPESMSSFPGPSCYNLGGTKATITDANFLIRRISKESFSGDNIFLNIDLAKKAIDFHIKEPLDFQSTEWASTGIIELAEEIMANSVRMRGIESGKKVPNFTMIASGGGGPLHAVGIAKKLGIKKIIIPSMAGVGSAIGFLNTKANFRIAQSVLSPLHLLNIKKTKLITDQLIKRALKTLSDLGISKKDLEIDVEVEIRYAGQGHQLAIPVVNKFKKSKDFDNLQEAFTDRYQEEYGFSMPGVSIELVTILVSCNHRIPHTKPCFSLMPTKEKPKKIIKCPIFDFTSNGWEDYFVVYRDAIGENFKSLGPMVIREKHTSTLVPKGWHVKLHSFGHLVLTKVNS